MGVWIGIVTLIHPEAVVLRLQQAAAVFVAEEGQLDSGQWERYLQIGAQGLAKHSFIDKLLLHSLQNRNLFRLDQQARLGDHVLTYLHRVKQYRQDDRLVDTCVASGRCSQQQIRLGQSNISVVFHKPKSSPLVALRSLGGSRTSSYEVSPRFPDQVQYSAFC